MEKEILENNNVIVTGIIEEAFTFSHEVFAERFFSTRVSVRRYSGVKDMIPVQISSRLIDTTKNFTGKRVFLTGQFRSYNWQEDGKSHLSLFLMVTEFIEAEEEPFDRNEILLDGFLCKPPQYRITPLGREVADILLAVNRHYAKVDYIPCVVWGRNARYVSRLKVGNALLIHGRIQSREYQKKLPDGLTELRTAYEISVSALNSPLIKSVSQPI